MANGHVRRVFPGGNTSLGFYSLYEYIVSPRANKIFILKGGPGVGKSSFMKGIAEKLLSLGMDIEYHHCSSDNNSLDGIYIPSIDVAFIDGTAPHRVMTNQKPAPSEETGQALGT